MSGPGRMQVYSAEDLEAAIEMRNTMINRINQTPWKAVMKVFGPSIQQCVMKYIRGEYDAQPDPILERAREERRRQLHIQSDVSMDAYLRLRGALRDILREEGKVCPPALREASDRCTQQGAEQRVRSHS